MLFCSPANDGYLDFINMNSFGLFWHCFSEHSSTFLLVTIVSVCLFDYSHCNGYKVVSHDFLWLTYSWCIILCKLQVSKQSDSYLLKVILHLQLLRNAGCIPWVAQNILVSLWFWFAFPGDWDVEQLSMCILVICIYSLKKCYSYSLPI